MSYTPTNWKAGDTVTSAKLNKMEQGIANAEGANILVAHLINSTEDEEIKAPLKAVGSNIPTISGTLDVTLGEIENADFTIIKLTTDYGVDTTYIESIYYDEYFNGYVLTTTLPLPPGGAGSLALFAINDDDYPTTPLPQEDN